MTEIDAKKVIMMPKVFLGRKVVESRFLSNDLFSINVFKTFSKNVTKRLNKLRSTDTSGSANKNRLDGEISNDTYNERVVAREKRISVNRQDIFGDKIYGKGLKEIIDKNILDVDAGENKDKFSENVADEIVDHLKETSFKKYSEIYGSKEKELKEIEKDVKEKVRELADSYIHPDMNQSDERKFKQELDDYLVEQLPQDTIRKKEEELFEQEEKEELRKQNDKLRTIGRALPMLIMASKNSEKLELGNIENSVSDEIFEEVFNESGATEKFTKEDFDEMLAKTTYSYCGISLAQIEELGKNGKLNNKRSDTRGYTLEIDRKLPNLEYSKKNCCMACYWCNNAKTDEFSPREFKPIAEGIRRTWNERLKAIGYSKEEIKDVPDSKIWEFDFNKEIIPKTK